MGVCVTHWLRCIGFGAAAGLAIAVLAFRVSEQFDANLIGF
jgi:hypothetical protein